MEKLEMEKLEKALLCVTRIAEGRNPVSDAPVQETDVLNNPEIIRNMFFVKEVLTAVMNNGGSVGRAPATKKKEFPVEVLSSYKYEEDKTITRLTEQLNTGVNGEEYRKLSYKTITDWLKGSGYLLETVDNELDRRATISTEKGQKIGITHSLETGRTGIQYYRVKYDRTAQEFIVKSLPLMLGAKEGAGSFEG